MLCTLSSLIYSPVFSGYSDNMHFLDYTCREAKIKLSVVRKPIFLSGVEIGNSFSGFYFDFGLLMLLVCMGPK
jgi:hypothetical protein